MDRRHRRTASAVDCCTAASFSADCAYKASHPEGHRSASSFAARDMTAKVICAQTDMPSHLCRLSVTSVMLGSG